MNPKTAPTDDHERWIKQEGLPDDLVECYNPHPVMTTEWCASEENPSCLNYPDDDEEEARYIARNWEEVSVWTRQVTGWKQMPNE